MSRRRRRARRLGAYAGAGGSTDLFPWLLAAAGAGLIMFRGKISDAVISAMRTPQDILDAVDAENPVGTADLQPGWWPEPPGYMAGSTWCSKFVARVTARLGTPVIFGQYGTLVNAQINWLDAGNENWYKIADRDSAQNAAISGKVVLATYYNPGAPPNNHGHIAIVLPLDGAMQIAQAGATNFNRGLLARGFGNIQPIFYGHS